MSYQVRLILLVWIIVLTSNFFLCDSWIVYEKKNYGEPCKGYGGFSCGDILEMSCIDNICKCDKYRGRKQVDAHTKKLNCQLELNLGNHCKNDSSCSPDEHCIQPLCQCNDNKVLFEGKCTNITYSNPMERCFVKDNILVLCDYNQFSFCKNSRCACFSEYYYNTTLSTCKPKKESFAYKRHGSYKVKPREYCLEDSDCIEGLRCKNFTCACPRSCHYKSSEEICDCGNISLEVPSAVLWAGGICGILSILFWGFLIRRTYNKRLKKSTEVVRIENEENAGIGLMPPAMPLNEKFNTYDNEISAPKMAEPPPYTSHPNPSPWMNSNDTQVSAQPSYKPPESQITVPYPTSTEASSLFPAQSPQIHGTSVHTSENAIPPYPSPVIGSLGSQDVPFSSTTTPTNSDHIPPLTNNRDGALSKPPTIPDGVPSTLSTPATDTTAFYGPYPTSPTQIPVGPYPISIPTTNSALESSSLFGPWDSTNLSSSYPTSSSK